MVRISERTSEIRTHANCESGRDGVKGQDERQSTAPLTPPRPQRELARSFCLTAEEAVIHGAQLSVAEWAPQPTSPPTPRIVAKIRYQVVFQPDSDWSGSCECPARLEFQLAPRLPLRHRQHQSEDDRRHQRQACVKHRALVEPLPQSQRDAAPLRTPAAILDANLLLVLQVPLH